MTLYINHHVPTMWAFLPDYLFFAWHYISDIEFVMNERLKCPKRLQSLRRHFTDCVGQWEVIFRRALKTGRQGVEVTIMLRQTIPRTSGSNQKCPVTDGGKGHVLICWRKYFLYSKEIVSLAASSGKRNVMVWRPSVCPSICLSVPSAYSPWLTRGSTRRGQRTFLPDSK